MTKDLTIRERVLLKQRIDLELDSLYEEAAGFGKGLTKFAKHSRSQLRNLETIVATATRTSALKNHVKNQTGKDRLRKPEDQTWARSGGEHAPLGVRTMALLDRLAERAVVIVQSLLPDNEGGEELARTVEIELQRGVVQTAVCAALYSPSETDQ